MRSSSPVRWVVLLAAALSSCTTVLGIDKDYYEVGGSAGSGVTMMSGGSGTGGQGGGAPPGPCGGSASGVCLPAIPAPWMPMYVSVDSTAVGMGPESCPDQSMPSRFFEASTVLASCSECTCSSPEITCSAPFVGWEDSSCTGASINLNAGDGSCIVTGSAINGIQPLMATSTATCAPSTVMVTKGDLWAGEHSLCAAAELPEGICEIGKVCVEDTGLPICIQAAGDVAACPEGWEDADRYQHYLTADDNRGCHACSCAPPNENLCTGGTYQIFDDAACGGASVPANEGDPCVPVVNSLGVLYVAPTLGAAICTAGGGEPNGSVTGSVAVTLCCR